MRWKKHGIVWKPDGKNAWAKTHAMAPTPFLLNENTIRVFITCLDEKGRGRPGYVDLKASDPTQVIGISAAPLLDIGEPGAFDDNGLVALGIVQPKPGLLYMYYAGFELCTQIRYRIFTGLAISRDDGVTFNRHSRTPILDRTDDELFFRCGSFAMLDEGKFKLWYIAGSEWTDIEGKALPVYDLRYQESSDGIHWAAKGHVSMTVGEDEHGLGRPWVVKRGPEDYQLFYSIRRRSLGAYRLGYAESKDGIHWQRKDSEMGLEADSGGFDSQAMMYTSVITIRDRTYCFYNGNGFGEDGFALAELL